ncbi:MAG: hypothetical protein A2946_04120 [Candidatus Liptonbacteria bacterium RIFCSPLOWO2_01_FULL_53_13]|uniref:Uncharacterized protein n=1 Tax=Candidatus Liptonbacteria bacterium RIFCSPLOWO2_01_FULL_53_13 TaxID=1798651 RepID=A0A1G2CNB9_9BACT|nr:MAG: hypothetical protein A2946_04120 [Candidatus Liptonbacteria bacterium RIFCSPLOWO2_01_FULL_53_13]
MENEQEIKELVIARLKTLPNNKDISIGSSGEFSKDELIEAVENEDQLGKKLIEVEMNFLRTLKDGLYYE